MNTGGYTMKKISVVFIVLVCFSFLVLPTGQASAAATRTEFAGIESPDPDDPGFPGEMWISGRVLHIRGMISVYEMITSDPRVGGHDVVTINTNFDLQTFSGRMWGTFCLSNDNGYWFGTWTGERALNGYAYIRGVGDGYGDYEGLKIFLDIVRLSPDPAYPEDISGYILDPGE
jgi:hypothetical protein